MRISTCTEDNRWYIQIHTDTIKCMDIYGYVWTYADCIDMYDIGQLGTALSWMSPDPNRHITPGSMVTGRAWCPIDRFMAI